MGRTPKAWYWEKRKAYYVTVQGKRHLLGTTEREAKRALKEVLSSGAPPSPEGDLQTLINAFQGHVNESKSPATAEWYERHLQSLVDSCGSRKLAKLTSNDIEKWPRSHPAWSEGTKAGAYRAVRAAFRWAMKRKYVFENPILGVEKPTEGAREVVISPEQFQFIIETTRDREFQAAIPGR